MSQLSALSDEEILLSFQSGNRQAYELIYERYWMILFRHADRILQDEEEAKDVVQEVFTVLWLKGHLSYLISQLLHFCIPLPDTKYWII